MRKVHGDPEKCGRLCLTIMLLNIDQLQ